LDEQEKKKIGWKKRAKIPGTLKEDGMLVGYGMATGVFGAGKGAASVKATLQQDGYLLLQSAVSDMGTGTTTAMTKIAAENLGMPLSKIKFKLGDSDLPPGPTQGGSTTTSTLGSAVNLICNTLKQSLKELAIQHADNFKGSDAKDLEVKTKYSIHLLMEIKNIDYCIDAIGRQIEYRNHQRFSCQQSAGNQICHQFLLCSFCKSTRASKDFRSQDQACDHYRRCRKNHQ